MQRDVNFYRIKVYEDSPELEIIPGFISHVDGPDGLNLGQVMYSVGPNDYKVLHPCFDPSDLNEVIYLGDCEGGDCVVLIADKDSDRRSDIKKIHEFCFKEHGLFLNQGAKLLRGMRACTMFNRGTKE